jgi:tRNA modification GTPase
MDLPQALDRGILQQVNRTESPVVEVSASQAAGLAALEEAMEAQAVGDRGGIAESSYFTNARQSALLRQAQQDLQLAIDAAKQNATLDIIAVQLQGAYASLGLVIGEAVGEDLLDEIFSRFCLGK